MRLPRVRLTIRRMMVVALGLVSATWSGPARAEVTPRLRASWKEKDARVVVFSPDGRSLVSTGGEGHQLRDASTGTVRSLLARPRVGFYGPVFSPDGRTLYAEIGTDDFKPVGVSNLTVWDVATGRPKATFAHVHEGMGNGHFVLSADGNRLAFLDNSERLPMKVETSKIGFGGRTIDVALNVNPGLPRVVIWDVTRWERVVRVDGGLPMAFSRDGKILATGDRDWHAPVAKVWEVDTGRLRSVLRDRPPGIWPIVISPEGRYLASFDHKMISLWDLADGRRWGIEPQEGVPFPPEPVFSPDGRLLFPGGRYQITPRSGPLEMNHAYDLAGMPPRRLDMGPGELVISPDGRRCAVASGRLSDGVPQTVTFRDLPSLREGGRSDAEGMIGVGFSPDGRWLAIMARRHGANLLDHPSEECLDVVIIDPATAKVRCTIPSPGWTWGNYGWKFSPDGNTLAVCYRTGSNRSRPGEPEPFDLPMTLELWEIPPN